MGGSVMKGMMKGVALGAVVLATSACYEHTFTVGQGAPTGPVVYSEWHNSWLGGLIGERNIDIDTVCPSGNATIHDEQSFLNGLVAGLTAGIYTPTEVKIRCDTGRSVDVRLDEGEVMSILRAPEFMERIEHVMPERLETVELGVRDLVADWEQ